LLIAIDPGHGGSDPGGGSCKYFQEKDWTLKVSLYQKGLLESYGHQAILTREADLFVPLLARGRMIRKSGAVCCLSNHVNHVSDPAAFGLEAFHSLHAKPDLAQAITKEILATRLIRPRSGIAVAQTRPSEKHPGQDYYTIHTSTGAVPTVILEYGFASNPIDAEVLARDWQALARAAAHGLLNHWSEEH